ncbi:MAG: prepilin-type N-terminal cleavage/methylation domain-containing protein [Verrucomicrobiae bacterium]|nr:prepilin-type N-terminal cleavage/methylation domain-containing protein [Verrucomicrobiae bacterium]MCB1093080.1 prepilin-type N-terminal cleavage/methylation domain-containing protein [Verrucomicrobiae bacterium]
MRHGLSRFPASKRNARHASAFTLVEIIIALTILAILAGITIPTVQSIENERAARAPVSELARLARTVRSRAMAEQQPYQIAFDQRGFHAARFYNPYGKSEEFDQLVQDIAVIEQQQEIIEASKKRGIDMSEGLPPTAEDRVNETLQEGLRYHESYELPDDVRYSLLFWGETEWLDMTGSGEFRRWVFQPSGMCQPLKIRVESEHSFFEVEFHPLTGDVKSEKSWVE